MAELSIKPFTNYSICICISIIICDLLWPYRPYASWLRLSGMARYASAMRLFCKQNTPHLYSMGTAQYSLNKQNIDAALHHTYSCDKLNRSEAVMPVIGIVIE